MRAAWCCMKGVCMSMIEQLGDRPRPRDIMRSDRGLNDAQPRETPIVPKNSIAGRALVAVVAIMTFLASLTTGAVVLVRASANDWTAEVAREITIQVRPLNGRDIEADVGKASDIARAAGGVASVRVYTKEESARLLEPWLGTGLPIDELPVPRMIVVRTDGKPDIAQLTRTLKEQVSTASVDDHRGWIDRMRRMAGTSVAAGVGILVLVLTATVLSVTFATRGAMATNKPIVEVLHLIGAKDSFISNQFQRHFLMLGLEGGLIGGVAALFLFALASGITNWSAGTPDGDQMAALFGDFSLGPFGYAVVSAQVLLLAFVTATTSRRTVNRTLYSVQ